VTGSNDAGDGSDGAGSNEDGRDPSDRLERVVATVSVAFTVVLLAFVLWQAATTPSEAVPTASIETVETPPYRDSGPETLRVTVRFDNEGGVGIESATVGVECGGADRTLQFDHVPADGYKTTTVTCPVGSEPSVTVESWTDN
jgi:hypothetical protein